MFYSKQVPKINVNSFSEVWLHCPNAKFKKNRIIGKIDYSKKLYNSAPKNSKHHKFNLDNSLSLPYDLIYKPQKGFLYICIKFDGKKIYSSSLAFKVFGVERQFKTNGYEKQVFLQIDKFHKSLDDARKAGRMLKDGDY